MHHEDLLGPFDGVQTQFSASFDYAPGTLRALTPLLETEANVTELGGKNFELDEAPIEGDVLILVYRIL
jgi:hypothetical protein